MTRAIKAASSLEVDHRDVLATAVKAIGGSERPGQVEMADAIAECLESDHHLLVQAGTGTGKSLGYLAPALLWLVRHPGKRIVVATATLALQSQLANNDIPAAVAAVESVTGHRPQHAILKGRTNYVCLLRLRDGTAQDQEALIPAGDLIESIRSAPQSTPESALGAEVLAIRAWAEEQARGGGLADRDDAPSHTERAWAQVSIPVRECLGAQRCPYGDECFVESSRDAARAADLVVTNHALLAINAMHGGTALPEHSAVIIDEAHELVSRVTGAASAELSPQIIERVARRALTFLEDEVALRVAGVGHDISHCVGKRTSGTHRGPRFCIRHRLCRGAQRRPDRSERTERRGQPGHQQTADGGGSQRDLRHRRTDGGTREI